MWQTVDYKGNTVKWYEAELIEKIKELIKPVIIMNTCNNCDGVGYGSGCKDIGCGEYAAYEIYKAIKENER